MFHILPLLPFDSTWAWALMGFRQKSSSYLLVLTLIMLCNLHSCYLTLLHSERPKCCEVLAFLSAIGLKVGISAEGKCLLQVRQEFIIFCKIDPQKSY